MPSYYLEPRLILEIRFKAGWLNSSLARPNTFFPSERGPTLCVYLNIAGCLSEHDLSPSEVLIESLFSKKEASYIFCVACLAAAAATQGGD